MYMREAAPRSRAEMHLARAQLREIAIGNLRCARCASKRERSTSSSFGCHLTVHDPNKIMNVSLDDSGVDQSRNGGIEAELRDVHVRGNDTSGARNHGRDRKRTILGAALLTLGAVAVGVAVGLGLSSTRGTSTSTSSSSSSIATSNGQAGDSDAGGMYDIYLDDNGQEQPADEIDSHDNNYRPNPSAFYTKRPTRRPTPPTPSSSRDEQLQNANAPTKQSVLDILYELNDVTDEDNKQQDQDEQTEQETTTLSKPNVLMIPIDDLNTWIGYMGKHPQNRTPNFDRLSDMGLSFTNAHSASTICNPSRAALWSGLRPSTSGCYDNKDEPWTRFIAEGLNLNAHFKKHGWYTAARGKTYHSSKAGFYKAEEKKTVYPSEWHEYPKTEKKPKPIPGYLDGFTQDFENAPNYRDEDDPDYHTAEFCVEQLGKFSERDGPTFLACGIIKPHLPWAVPQKYYDMYPLSEIEVPAAPEDDLDDVPKMGWDLAQPHKEDANVTKLGRQRNAVQGYLASVAYADFCLGRILDAYEAMPKSERDNTIVVLWSDHGYHLGQKKHWKKATLWEESSEIPFIWVVPGLTSPGTLCHRPVDTMSVYPTLCKLMGLPVPDHVEGADIRQLLGNPHSKWDGKALSTMGYANHAVVDERYRYIRYEDGTEELYDHDTDPFEYTNLAGYGGMYNLIKSNLARFMPKADMKKWDLDFSQTCNDRYDSADTVKLCGDGTSFVARNPKSNCDFTPCPE